MPRLPLRPRAEGGEGAGERAGAKDEGEGKGKGKSPKKKVEETGVGEGTGGVRATKALVDELVVDTSDWPQLGGKRQDPEKLAAILAKPMEEWVFDDFMFVYNGPKPKFVIGKYPFGAGHEKYGISNIIFDIWQAIVLVYETVTMAIFNGVLACIRPFVGPLIDKWDSGKEERRQTRANKRADYKKLKQRFPKWWMRNPAYYKFDAWFQEYRKTETYIKNFKPIAGYWQNAFPLLFDYYYKGYAKWLRRWCQVFVIESAAIEMCWDLLWRCFTIYWICYFIMPHRVSIGFTVVCYYASAWFTGSQTYLAWGSVDIEKGCKTFWWSLMALRYFTHLGGPPVFPIPIV